MKWYCNCQIHGGRDKCELTPIHDEEIAEQINTVLNGKTDKLKEQNDSIILYNDKTEFLMRSGSVKPVYRKYGGFKRRTGFSKKVFCGSCGEMCRRGTFGKDNKKAWICEKCKKTKLPEEILRAATEMQLGENYEAKAAECVKTITVFDDRMVFCFNDDQIFTSKIPIRREKK